MANSSLQHEISAGELDELTHQIRLMTEAGFTRVNA